MKYKIAIFALMASLSACAKPPEKIQAVQIDDAQYASMQCDYLTRQISSYQADYKTLAQQQQNAATGDAVGVMFLGVPTSSLTGGDKETAIAVLKGKMEAADRVYSKNCSAKASPAS